MKQSRAMSIFETVGGTALGFAISWLVQSLVVWWFNLPLSHADNLGIIGIFTIASLIRGYGWRRLMEAMHVRRPLSPFMQAVIAERFRQVDGEGYDFDHDDDHKPGELAQAGLCYVEFANDGVRNECDRALLGVTWPWDLESYKPIGIRRDLIKGAALIIAEGERHDRNRKSARVLNFAAKPLHRADIKAGLS